MGRYRGPAELGYVDQFLRHAGAPALLAAGLFPSAKELTESVGALNGLRRGLKRAGALARLGDADGLAIVPGDGRNPRTAALLAASSNWDAVAVDPALRPRDWGLPRVAALARPADAATVAELAAGRSVVALVCVHAHVDPAPLWAALPAGRRIAVAIPCCAPSELPVPPLLDYVDERIASPANRVRVWLDDALREPA